MSRRDDMVTLQQMLDHAREAIALSQNSVTAGSQEARILELALIRLLEVLGEAANRVSQETRSNHDEVSWSQIISLRNRLIHGYDSVDMAIIGKIIARDLPQLVQQIEAILETTSGD